MTAALEQGRPQPWDFSPPNDGARAYFRNHLDLGELEEWARYPKIRPPTTVSEV